MLDRKRIRKHEFGLLFRQREFHDLLSPGDYRLWRPADHVDVVSTLETRFAHPQVEALFEEPAFAPVQERVELDDNQRGLVWKSGRLAYVVGPGRHAFWKTPYELTIEIRDVNEFELEHPLLRTIIEHAEAKEWLHVVDVLPHQESLLFRDGVMAKALGPGRYAFWRGSGSVNVEVIDKREQIADVAGQEIMTSDKVTLRINLLVVYRVVDSSLLVAVVEDHVQALYREAQLALRAAVGTRKLDDLLSDKDAVSSEVAKAVSSRVAEFGIEVRSIGLRDIILPGEMKSILNRVIEAEKQAQANLIRRREETAAARSQANTAKLLAENPTLARMKEMETLSETLAGSRATFVFGQGSLTEQIRSLIVSDCAAESAESGAGRA